MVFISVRGRVLINAEALNMTESVGNYTKHRRVPVIHPQTYTVHFVPAISGETIAHRYQEIISELANGKLPVCNLCKKGRFLKSSNLAVFASQFRDKLQALHSQNQKINSSYELEKFIIENCIVEDVGGFLFAPTSQNKKEFEEENDFDLLINTGVGNTKKNSIEPNIRNVKRTSNFFTGYMIPVREVLDQVVIEPQLHMRYALGTPFAEIREGQMIYYVELASAVYTFSFDLDTKYIGTTTFEKVEELPNKKDKEKLAIEALKRFLLELDFGAKRTRFLPVVKPESMVIAIADDVWTVPSPFSVKYLEEVVNKLLLLSKLKDKENNNEVKLFIYIDENILTNTTEYVKQTTKEIIESFYNALTEIEEILKSKGDNKLIDIDKIKKEWLEKLITDKVNELAKSKDLSYVNKIAKEYTSFKENIKNNNELKDKFNDIIKVYDDYNKFIKEAFKFALSKLEQQPFREL